MVPDLKLKHFIIECGTKVLIDHFNSVCVASATRVTYAGQTKVK